MTQSLHIIGYFVCKIFDNIPTTVTDIIENEREKWTGVPDQIDLCL